MAAFPNSEQDGVKADSSPAHIGTPIYFAGAAGGPIAALHSEIEARLTPCDVIPLPTVNRDLRSRFEEAVSMCVGFLALGGFVAGLASMFVR
ncbi:MAG: hypothetical protein JJE34_10650 [Alphaproteobacteria bacterium]|nr:hypothetical protein [Alphaproteobacteria bacterium]